jgi:hypothetical protein
LARTLAFSSVLARCAGKRELEKRLADGAYTVDRRIKFAWRTVQRFNWQKREHDPFLSTVLAGPRLFLIGDGRSLSEL